MERLIELCCATCEYYLPDADGQYICPHCGEYPFDSSVEIEFHEPVDVLMWTGKPTDEQREAVKWK